MKTPGNIFKSRPSFKSTGSTSCKLQGASIYLLSAGTPVYFLDRSLTSKHDEVPVKVRITACVRPGDMLSLPAKNTIYVYRALQRMHDEGINNRYSKLLLMENQDRKKGWSEESADMVMPPVIFGTSSLGNLFEALAEETKLGIVKESVRLSKEPVVFDSAGKYGAGLALEVLGKCLKQLNVGQEDVLISNKLGWLRTDLKTAEPTFEPGVWKDLKHDAVQKISYDGIMECFEQGNELLGGYIPQLVSVHDPDEYLATATSEQESQQHYDDILDAYEALFDLKQQGRVKGIGVGAKDWRMIQRIAGDVALDWVMIANSMTIKSHPAELLEFVSELHQKGVYVINSAVFHSGFLVGSDYYDYKQIKRGTAENDALFEWRKRFFEVCQAFAVKPAAACVQFALHVPGVKSIALNTTNLNRVKENLEMAEIELPAEFWETLKTEGLVSENFQNKLRLVS